MKYKTIYIIIEDEREVSLVRGGGNITGHICYSLKEACEFLLKRVWYFEPKHRKWIKEMWDKYGPIEAWHNHVYSGWLYKPYYVKKRIKVGETK